MSDCKDEAIKTNSEVEVRLESFCLSCLLKEPLCIPSYQRIYCWEEKQVYRLLDDIVELLENTDNDKILHLGAIIIHEDKETNVWKIVDGQQRLVTLTLLFLSLNGRNTYSLSAQVFKSQEARAYIAYNKFLIENYIAHQIQRNANLFNEENIKKIKEKIVFSVLVLHSNSLDLAYTFFSNQNSRGKSLTDYELLKAHHLRYLGIEAEAIHLSSKWDSIITKSNDNDSSVNLYRLFDVYLFRSRKFIRKQTWDDGEKFKVKTEFEADLSIDEIPPFGEKFNFNESIQGGSHFFGYAEHFNFHYKIFIATEEYKALAEHLSHESHWKYKDCIEALLFAYYLKFNTLYLGEALICITKIISDHRYRVGRANLKSILEYASNSEIILMIEKASSPTFFLAEALNLIKKLPIYRDDEIKGIRARYKNYINEIEISLNKLLEVKKIKELCAKGV